MIETASGLSPLGKKLSRFAFEHSVEQSLIGIKDVADLEVSKGRKIRIWPDPKSARKEIEIFLFGPVWATLCHQRGVLPLHANAIVSGTGITAFAGHSGAGRSTTAASLGSLQFQLVADDILPVSFDESSTP